MKKLLPLALIVLLISVFAVGCGSDDNNNNNAGVNDNNNTENNEENNAAENNNSEEGSSTITVNHLLGETKDVPVNPGKVVVFDYGILDVFQSLDIDAVIGVPQGNIPEYLSAFNDEAKYTNVGTLFEPDFEVIYGLEPDLIIISGRQAEAYDELSKIAPTISVALDTEDFVNSFKGNMELIGKIFGVEEAMNEELVKIDDKIAELNNAATSSDVSGLVVMANDGSLSAYGPGSRFGIIHNEFGVEASDPKIEIANHGQNISFEYILDQDPEYIFVIDKAAVAGGETSAEAMFDNELIEGTKAAEEGNIIFMDPFYWYVATGGLTSFNGMVDDVLNAVR